jgi:hypothetical protein
VPAIPPYIIEPILWQRLSALLPRTEADHPLGRHRPRIPDRAVFEKLVQVSVFGCAYGRIADEWIEAGSMEALEEMALESYDRIIGLELRRKHLLQEHLTCLLAAYSYYSPRLALGVIAKLGGARP